MCQTMPTPQNIINAGFARCPTAAEPRDGGDDADDESLDTDCIVSMSASDMYKHYLEFLVCLTTSATCCRGDYSESAEPLS
jgi:hypothetical protein